MINFRFHLASLVAIFLALALGVVIGAGVIDRGVVDALDTRLNDVEKNANEVKDDNSALRSEIGENTDSINAFGNLAIKGTLPNADVGIVAVRGVDSDRVDLTANSLRAAGANVTGVLWLESPWKLEDRDQISSLATALGSTSRRPVQLRTQAWDQIAARFAQPRDQITADDDVLRALDDAGFVSFDGPPDGGDISQYPGLAASVVLVVGSDGDVPSEDVVMPAATAIAREDLELVAGDVYVKDAPDAGSRGSAFADLRNSELSTTVSTVDDLDTPQGPPTVPLALAGLLHIPAVVGHYGLASDAVLVPATS